MIIPSGHRVLVRQKDYDEHDLAIKRAKEAIPGFELAKDQNVRYHESVDEGVVVAIGPPAWKDFGGVPWADVGDNIVFAKHSGKKVEDPAEPLAHYVIINDEDVVAVIKE